MTPPDDMKLVPIEDLRMVKGVALPSVMTFRQLIITGPPGSGKTSLINRLGGWPEEGYIDLTLKTWWRAQALTYRPREVHLGFPFVGLPEPLTVFEKDWLSRHPRPELDFERIVFPPPRKGFFLTEPRTRFVFEFLLPPAEVIYAWRRKRSQRGAYPADDNLSLEQVRDQLEVFRAAAVHFHNSKMQVYIRQAVAGAPMRFDDGARESWAVPPPEPEPSEASPLRRLYTRSGRAPRFMATAEPQPLRGAVRIPWDHNPFQIRLGKQYLSFYQEFPLNPQLRRPPRSWIAVDPGNFFSGIRGFARIAPGRQVSIGRGNEDYDRLFRFSNTVAARHLSVANEKGDLVLSDLDPDAETFVTAIEDPEEASRIETRRQENLERVREALGGPVALLPPEEALETLGEVNRILAGERYRAKDSEGRPGGVLEIPARLQPVIVGDLHAQVDNLLKVLCENAFLEQMAADKACMIILGDAVHSEVDGQLEDMESSLLIMDLIFRLKRRFPDNLFYIRGNHDSFSPEVGKSGVPQSLMMRDRIRRDRGQDYEQEMVRFHQGLAYVAKSEGFIACHAAPVRSEVPLEMLVDLRKYPGMAHELVCNRIKRPAHPLGYTKGDVKRFRRSLGVPKQTPLIVGHNPLSKEETAWPNAAGFKNHHITYCGHPDKLAVFIRIGPQMVPLEYPAEPLIELINDG